MGSVHTTVLTEYCTFTFQSFGINMLQGGNNEKMIHQPQVRISHTIR